MQLFNDTPPTHDEEFGDSWRRWLLNFSRDSRANVVAVYYAAGVISLSAGPTATVGGTYYIEWEIDYTLLNIPYHYTPVGVQIVASPLYDDFPLPRIVWRVEGLSPKVRIRMYEWTDGAATSVPPWSYVITFTKSPLLIKVI